MDDRTERLRRRSAAYRQPAPGDKDGLQIARFLKQVQDDNAAFANVGDMPQDLGPAYLRSRAEHYRALAARQPDLNRARIFSDLATLFEKQARIKEQRPVQPKG